MRKRLCLTILAGVASLCCAFGLAGCKPHSDPNHEHNYKTEVIAATCTEKGYTRHYCDCGESYQDEETEALGHDWGDWKTENGADCTTAGTEKHVCKRDSSHFETRPMTSAGHSWGNWEQTKKPDCENDGLEVRTCSKCDAHEDHVLTKIGHVREIIPAKPSTCTEPGLTEGEFCKVCGAQFKERKYIDSLGHAFEDFVCNRCGIVDAAAPFNDDLLYIEVKEGNAVIGYTVGGRGSGEEACTAKVIKIPNEHNGKPVIGIDDYAFYTDETIVSVTTSANLKTIGEYAFASCKNLNFVNLADGLTSIEANAFTGTPFFKNTTRESGALIAGSYLLEVSQDVAGSYKILSSPQGVTGENIVKSKISLIADSAFSGCNNLTEIVLDDEINYIGKNAFAGCAKVETLSIPEGIIGIGEGAFDGFAGLTTVVLPAEAITHIPTENLVSVAVINGEEIPNQAFKECKKLSRVDISINSLERIGVQAFYGCTSLEEITIPAFVKEIGDYAFENCSKLSTVKASGVNNPVMNRIGNGAFRYCTSLTSINIPLSVSEIGDNAFYNCTKIETLTLPDKLASIGTQAFYNCSAIKKLAIPSGVTTIAYDAFRKCAGLEEITAEGNANFIATGNCLIEKETLTLFLGCNKTDLSSIEILNKIAPYAFKDCNKLTTLNLPNGITEIGERAFEGCSGLSSVSVPSGVTILSDYAFSNCGNLETVELNEGLNKIGRGAFSNCLLLTAINLPDSLETISSNAFFSCSLLKTVDFGTGVTTIENSAFNGCGSLENLALPASVNSIGKSAFSGCSGLKTITVEAGNAKYKASGNCLIDDKGTLLLGCSASVIPSDGTVKSIGSEAFSGCGIESISIPASVANIYKSAFEVCNKLKTITFAEGLQSIGDRAFYNCSSIESLSLPASLASIGELAFRGLNALTSISVAADNNSFSSSGNCLIEKATKTVILGCKNSVIPTDESVEVIADGAFANLDISSVIIGKNIKQMGSGAFSGCSSLTVYFDGTAEEWGKIEKGDNAVDAGKVYFYSEAQPQGEGNFWHLVEGNPVKW